MYDNNAIVIMGMGKTGIACARFLTKQGQNIKVMDNRPNPPSLKTLKQEFPHVPFTMGSFDAQQLASAKEIILSPGLSLQEPALIQAKAQGVPIIGDIELFARYVNAPVVAITGSNGKSTVTTLVGEMAKQAGWRVQVGGNLGTPALDLLCDPPPQLYVLELSSFQLETTYSLNPKAATILNISADHLDRYSSLADYIVAKKRIFQGDGTIVINADDSHVVALLEPLRQHLSFSLRCQRGNFSICSYQGEPYFIQTEANQNQLLLPTTSVLLRGAPMRANMLAALALGHAVELPMSAMVDAMRVFRGLPHRCEWIANHQGIDWINDSKGTNVGATVAAIQGLEKPGQIILIAGGEGKGADFSPLAETIEQHCRACVLIGRDATLIAKVLTEVPVYYAKSMEEAVVQAATLAKTGDSVLLSPACASFDMFENYEHRGTVFVNAVKQLVLSSFP